MVLKSTQNPEKFTPNPPQQIPMLKRFFKTLLETTY
jgi:hypothetical protein